MLLTQAGNRPAQPQAPNEEPSIGLHCRSMRLARRWQFIATIGCALVAMAASGGHAALSALIGGSISLLAGIVYAYLAAVGSSPTAGLALRTVLRAEAAKILTIIVLLWLALAVYKQVSAVALIGAFALSTLIFSFAALARNR